MKKYICICGVKFKGFNAKKRAQDHQRLSNTGNHIVKRY
jgi:hypothetical protein